MDQYWFHKYGIIFRNSKEIKNNKELFAKLQPLFAIQDPFYRLIFLFGFFKELGNKDQNNNQEGQDKEKGQDQAKEGTVETGTPNAEQAEAEVLDTNSVQSTFSSDIAEELYKYLRG